MDYGIILLMFIPLIFDGSYPKTFSTFFDEDITVPNLVLSTVISITQDLEEYIDFSAEFL